MTNFQNWKDGAKDGIAIGLGYFAVSFTFGMLAVKADLSTFQAVLMSVTNLASAGQFAALNVISHGGTYCEMALIQFVLNLRYLLMSCALSQKLEKNLSLFHRFGVAFGITDEIFGVSSCREGKVSPYYSYGTMSTAIPGWGLGTLFGAISGSVMPASLGSALGVAIYGMFMAIIIPPARKNNVLFYVIGVAMLMSSAFYYLPVTKTISPGLRLITVTILVAAIAAWKFPIKDEIKEELQDER